MFNLKLLSLTLAPEQFLFESAHRRQNYVAIKLYLVTNRIVILGIKVCFDKWNLPALIWHINNEVTIL